MIESQTHSTKDGRRVIVREADANDAETIVSVINSVAAERVYTPIDRFPHDVDWERNYIQEHVKEKKDRLIAVAVLEGKIVGVCDLHPGRHETNRHVGGLGMSVVKDYREIGVGTAMMKYLMDWAKDHNVEKLYLSVFSTNRRAINLYKKFNFQVEGKRGRQYKIEGKYVDEVLMGKFL